MALYFEAVQTLPAHNSGEWPPLFTKFYVHRCLGFAHGARELLGARWQEFEAGLARNVNARSAADRPRTLARFDHSAWLPARREQPPVGYRGGTGYRARRLSMDKFGLCFPGQEFAV